MPKRLKIDVWSDIACPWCFIGKRRLETALREFPHADEVEVEWHAFQLDPAAPRVRDKSVPHNERLAKKYGVSVERAKAMNDRLVGIAAEEGLAFDFERIQPGNTFDAHRLLALAKQRGLQEALEERFMHGYLCEGAAIGDPATLLSLATDAGLDADEAQGVLASDLHARDVHGDLEAARDLGIDGVPFFRIGRYGVSGAQPAELLLTGLQRAFDELPAKLERLGEGGSADGPVCGPDGCVEEPSAPR
jgi:predicted DsbA family dithiol-disulfide isomerase